MNKIKLIAAAIALATAAYAAYYNKHVSIIQKRFPDIDPLIVRAAHFEMMKLGFTGALDDVDLDDLEAADAIFLKIVQEISPK